MRDKEDKYIVSYIERCIYNDYLYHAKKRRTESINTAYSLDDEAQNLNSACLAVDDEYPFMDYSVLESVLTRNEAEIVMYISILKYPLKEVAAWLHISPSAVCQTKTKALNKLREYYKKNKMID